MMFPFLLAGRSVERESIRIRGREECVVCNNETTLVIAGLFEVNDADLLQRCDVLSIDLFQRRVAFAGQGAVIAGPVAVGHRSWIVSIRGLLRIACLHDRGET